MRTQRHSPASVVDDDDDDDDDDDESKVKLSEGRNLYAHQIFRQ